MWPHALTGDADSPEHRPIHTPDEWDPTCTFTLEKHDKYEVGLQLSEPEYKELLESFRRLKWRDALSNSDLCNGIYNLTAGQVCPT